MRGLILVSARYKKKYSHDRYKIFFQKLSTELGFKLFYTDRIDVPKDVDTIIVGLQRLYTNSLMELADINKKVKIIGILGDPHSLDKIPGNDIKMFNRYDTILGFNDSFFRQKYPQYAEKFIFFPQFFAPYDRFTKFKINNSPINKCLLSGNLKPRWTYPFRNYINDNRNPKQIITLPYPGTFLKKMKGKNKNNYYIGDRYSKKIHDYFCSIVVSGFKGGVIAKFVEIPAVGTLMLCNEALDLKQMGFIANEHYIPINEKNVFNKVTKCLRNPKKYIGIRKAGMKLVRENHNINNRIETIKEIVEKL